MLTLYYARGTCALASHLALEHSGAPYEARAVDFSSDEQRSADYLAVNPKGRVPALVTDRGVLTETPAILVYLAQSFPDAALAPLDDPFELARAQAFNSYLCATVHVAHAHKSRGARWSDDPAAWEAMRRHVPRSMGECFALIEHDLLAGPWVLGERYSVCDMYLFTVSRWLDGDGVDVSRLPRVIDHRERMQRIPEVAKVLADEGG